MTSPSGSDWHPILLGWSKHTLDFYPQTRSSPSNSFLSKWHHLVAKTETKWNRSCLRLSSLSSSPHWIWSGLPSRIWPQPLGQGTGTSHLGLGHSLPSGLPASSLTPIILFCTRPPRDPFRCKFYPGLPWPNPPVAPSHTVQFRFSLWPWLPVTQYNSGSHCGLSTSSLSDPWLPPPSYLKLFSSLLTIVQPHWLSWCSLTSLTILLPQRICTLNVRLENFSPRYTLSHYVVSIEMSFITSLHELGRSHTCAPTHLHPLILLYFPS